MPAIPPVCAFGNSFSSPKNVVSLLPGSAFTLISILSPAETTKFPSGEILMYSMLVLLTAFSG